MIDINETKDGNLLLTIELGCEQELRDEYEKRGQDCIYDALESHSCNGSYTPFNPSYGNPFVGLTDAPCIAESMHIDDNGDCNILGRFWCFDNYMLECYIETLLDNGSVVFHPA
jgi:hypothetical protein